MNLNLFSTGRLFLTGLTLLATQAQGADFSIKNGDRIVFYGDSITDQRLYTTFAETFIVTRFPKLDVTFVHSGWGGDRVSGGGGGAIDLRLERDVFAYKPTVMTIMLGMNDGSYRAFDQGIFDQYRRGYERIVQSVKKTLPGIRLTLIQPSPFDDVTQTPRFEGGYNAVLLRYSDYVKELAQKEGAGVADLNKPVVAALEKAKTADETQAKKIIPDRVHPGASGHLLMAAELLKSWHAPAIVSSVEIDAAAKKVLSAQSARIRDLQSDGTVRWTQLDDALPLAVNMKDPIMALAINSSDFVQSLNRQPLKVTGLTAPRYTLNIDGNEAGAFTKEQLAEGLNLALLPTPMVKQATEVHDLTLKHNNLHFARWRQIQVPMAAYKSAEVDKATVALMKALDTEEEKIVKQQRAAAQPVARKFSLVPQ